MSKIRLFIILSIVVAVGAVMAMVTGRYGNDGKVYQGYIEGKYTYVASAVAGTLQNVPVSRGETIKQGQLLFKLDPEPEVSQLEAARQNLVRTQQMLQDLQKGQRDTVIKAIEAQRLQAAANLDFAAKTLERYQRLYKTNTISKASLDQAVSNYDALSEKLKEINSNLNEAKLGARENMIAAQKALVDSNAATLKQADWALKQKISYAPKDGILFDNLYETGEFVAAGSPIVIILPRDTFKVIFFIPQRMLSTVALGDVLKFSCDECKDNYKATVSFISPEPEYTPPVVFSQDSKDKLVYRIEAKVASPDNAKINVGQPVDVLVRSRDKFK
jgi:HlyD family secretion protein